MQSIDAPTRRRGTRWSQRGNIRRRRVRIDPARVRFIGLITMLAIAVATLGASLVHEAQRPTTSWVPVAKVPIPPGAALLPQDLELRRSVVPSWLVDQVPQRSASLIGQIADVAIDPNEIIETSMISHSAPSPRQPMITLSMPTSSIDRTLIQAGNRVDVVATYTAPSGVASTEVLASDLRVNSLGTSNGAYLVTVSVAHVETALAIYQAEQIAKIAIIGATGVTGHNALRIYPPIGGPHVP